MQPKKLSEQAAVKQGRLFQDTLKHSGRLLRAFASYGWCIESCWPARQSTVRWLLVERWIGCSTPKGPSPALHLAALRWRCQVVTSLAITEETPSESLARNLQWSSMNITHKSPGRLTVSLASSSQLGAMLTATEQEGTKVTAMDTRMGIVTDSSATEWGGWHYESSGSERQQQQQSSAAGTAHHRRCNGYRAWRGWRTGVAARASNLVPHRGEMRLRIYDGLPLLEGLLVLGKAQTSAGQAEAG